MSSGFVRIKHLDTLCLLSYHSISSINIIITIIIIIIIIIII